MFEIVKLENFPWVVLLPGGYATYEARPDQCLSLRVAYRCGCDGSVFHDSATAGREVARDPMRDMGSGGVQPVLVLDDGAGKCITLGQIEWQEIR